MKWRCFRYEVVDSTNDRAFEALGAGEAAAGDVFIANAQSKGRGTRGREWHSHPGGVYLSAILESGTMPLPGLWTLAGALAVHDVATDLGADVALTWPNDVVCATSGAKVAGVLAESRGLKAVGKATFVLGLGLNVTAAPDSEELDRARPVTCLHQLCEAVLPPLDGVVERLLQALDTRTDQALASPGATYDAFFDRCVQAERRVTVDLSGASICGTFQGIDPLGNIHILDEKTAGKRTVSIAHVRSIGLAHQQDPRVRRDKA